MVTLDPRLLHGRDAHHPADVRGRDGQIPASKDPPLPVQNPKFKEIEQFCDILSKKNGKAVRLPTSAEWEYAARVGTSSPAFAEKYHGPEQQRPRRLQVAVEGQVEGGRVWGYTTWPVAGGRSRATRLHITSARAWSIPTTRRA